MRSRIIVLGALLAAGAILPVSAGAAYFTLSEFSGPPARTIEMWGGGFAGGETVSITADNAALGIAPFETTASAIGDIGPLSFTVPANAPQGPLGLTATGGTSALSAGNSYYVQPLTPALSAVVAGDTPGSTILVSGSGFAPGEGVTLSLASGTALAAADATGAFLDAALVIPFVPPATYELTARGDSSGASAGGIFVYVNGFYASLSPSTYYVLPGSRLELTGSGFAPGETVEIRLAGGTDVLASSTAGTGGSFAGAAVDPVPFSFAGQTKTFRATGVRSAAAAEVTVTIGRLFPSVSPSAYWLMPGSTLSFTGSGYPNGENIMVLEGSGTSTLAVFPAPDGTFRDAGAMTVPYSYAGSGRTFLLRGERSGAEASASVIVGALYPTLSPSSYYVSAGNPFTVSGTGFAPGEDISFRVAEVTSTIRATANEFGNFFLTGPFRAPVAAGPARFTANGGTSGASAEFVLTVGQLFPALNPSEYYLLPLQSFSLAGSGFVPEEFVEIRLGSSTLATVQANAFGNFTRSLSAPAVSGSHTYSATGLMSGAAGQVTVTVAGLMPAVTAEDYFLYPGEEVYVRGTGFLANEKVAVMVGGIQVATSMASGVGNTPLVLVGIPFGFAGSVPVGMTGLSSGASAATSISLAAFYPNVTPGTWWTPPGTLMTFTGTGFAPLESVSVRVNGTSTGISATTDPAGGFSLTGLRLPGGADPARFVFTGAKSGATANVDIGVAPVFPWMFLDAYYAPAGAPLTVFGRGFVPGEQVSISADGTEFALATTDAFGNFDLAARVPGPGTGDKVVRGTGIWSAAVGTTGITVAPLYLDLQLLNYAVPRGGVVNFLGGGYIPGERLDVRTDRTGDAVAHSFLAAADGRFNDAGYVIPGSFAEGNLTFTLTGQHSQTPRTVTIYVQ